MNQEEAPAYPQAVLEAVARLFTTEFPDSLADLTAQDVLSRVQYRASDPHWQRAMERGQAGQRRVCPSDQEAR